ncbi:MAG: hypothetical protein AB1830_02820 [Pseudomonadota bacterium]
MKTAEALKRLMAGAFSAMFLVVAASLAVLSVADFVRAFVEFQDKELISGIVRAINTAFISLATFEVGVGIGKEYTVPEGRTNLYQIVRRTVTRFVSVVCIALVLEGLIMVIKYSQLELAGNLYYPVAVLVGASVLLVSLGLFIYLTRPEMVTPLYRTVPVSEGWKRQGTVPGVGTVLPPDAAKASFSP